MGKWADEFQKQKGQFERERMNTDNALQLVAYWAQELGVDASGRKWAPLVAKIMRDAPKPQFNFFQRMLKKKPIAGENFVNNAFKSLFDLEPKRPAVTADVRAEVLDFMKQSARKLDNTKPNLNVPRFKKSDFQRKGFNLLLKAPFFLTAPKKKSNFGAGAILFLILLAMKD